MLPTPPQPGAAAAVGAGAAVGACAAGAAGAVGAGAGGEKEEFGESAKFHNWAGRGAAGLILPLI